VRPCFQHVDDVLWNPRPEFELWIENNNKITAFN
jgi:hypothetical protein